MLRFVDNDLAVVWPKRFVHRGVEALKRRGFHVACISDEDEAARGKSLNFVTLGPRQILMAAGNPLTQAFYEELGIICQTVPVDELSKAAGAIGCLTGVLSREMRL